MTKEDHLKFDSNNSLCKVILLCIFNLVACMPMYIKILCYVVVK